MEIVLRSKLFVPGSRPELFSKALASQADAISMDLEDSVIESKKPIARENIAAFLQTSEVQNSNKTIIVRTNSLDSIHFEADVLATIQTGLSMLNLPKVESADDIQLAVKILEQAEINNNIHQPATILANIETVKGLRLARKIASAHPRVVGLQLGLNDLFSSMGIDRTDRKNVHAVMFSLRMATAEAGVFAYDGAFTDFHDEPGFRQEATMAQQLGYLGKSCIHPNQVRPANEVFTPSDEAINFATRIIDAARTAKMDGAGAFTLDGRMIDLPAIKRAEVIINTFTRSRK